MTINIKATGMEMTDAIKQYAEDKFEDLIKFFGNIQHMDIDIGMRSHHHHKGKIFYAELNVSVPKKEMIRVVKEADDLYKAIDKVRDHLKSELKEFKEKLKTKDKKQLRGQKEYKEE